MNRKPNQRKHSLACFASGGKPRWGKVLVVLLVALLSFGQSARAVDRSAPTIHHPEGYNVPGRAYLKFGMNYFNYHESNSGFSGDVELWLNGVHVCNLNDAWEYITDRRPDKKEDYIKDHDYWSVLGEELPFDKFGYKGVVVLTNSGESNDKWISIDVNILLEEIPTWRANKTIDVMVSGRWEYVNDKNQFQPVKDPCNVIIAFDPPSFGTWPSVSQLKYTGNKAVSITMSGMKRETYDYYNGTKNSGTWTYGLQFSNQERLVLDSKSLLTILKYSDNTAPTAVSVNSNFKEANTGITEATVTLEVDNWKSYELYPAISRIARKYTMFQYDKSYTRDVNFLNVYSSPVWVNGNPRPFQASSTSSAQDIKDSAMVITANIWTKEVTLEWTPQVYDKSHLNSGKWVIFRDGEKLGTVAFSASSAIKRTTYVDKTSKDYDATYTYTVAFQPNGWADITSPSEATGLTASMTYKLERKSPFPEKGAISATNDQENQIQVTCSFQSFSDATTSKTYTLSLYRRAKGTSDWGDPIKTATVNSPQTNSYTFTDAGLENPCAVYQYRVGVVAQDNYTFYTPEANGGIAGESAVTSVSASRGTYSGMVRITWEAKQIGTSPTYYYVQRRLMSSTDEKDYVTLYKTSGVVKTYSYEDVTAQAGSYYQYRVQCYRECDGVLTEGVACETDGFALATGVISGRVSYGTGTAVQGVKVSLTKTSGSATDAQQSFNALRFGPVSSYVRRYTGSESTTLFNKPWTVQMYFKSDAVASTRCMLFKTEFMTIYLFVANDGKAYVRADAGGSKYMAVWAKDVLPGVFYNLSVASDGVGKATIRLVDENGMVYENTTRITDAGFEAYKYGGTSSYMSFGNDWYDSGRKADFTGVIDECRFWTRELSKEEILNNYNRILSGSEDGLYLYYKLDEGVIGASQLAYDYSKKGGVPNGRHGNIRSMKVTDEVPTSNQLSVYGLTDSEGNYTISGIPFSGDGTTYSVIPTMGVHSFTPNKVSRFVSASSLVYSGVDFTDESSFKVNGIVRYTGTTIPVEDCVVYVDGQAASKDGELVTSNSDGKFTVSVPIGNHYVEVRKDGHTFSLGRYPEDPNNVKTTALFDRDITAPLTFWDNTTVNFTGRIVGGEIQAAKPLGYQQSNNNIGRAIIDLVYQNDNGYLNVIQDPSAPSTTESLIRNPKEVVVASQTLNIRSNSYRGDSAHVNHIYIVTDSLTGEFSALVPPLLYNLSTVKLVNTSSDNPNKGKALFSNLQIDLRDPLTENADTTIIDGKAYVYNYHTAMVDPWHTDATFNVTQSSSNPAPGAFGIPSFELHDDFGWINVPVYEYTQKSGLNYFFGKDIHPKGTGYPLYVSMEKYTFDIEAYEEYVNYDAKDPVLKAYICDRVPLSGLPVTISNALSADQIVYKEDNPVNGTPGDVYDLKTNSINLDSLGRFSYTWMAGLPKITSPHARAVQFYYQIDGRTFEWREGGLEAIILGSVPSGNNYVTAGPDIVDMVLRDPPGTASSATWVSGTTTSTIRTEGTTWSGQTYVGVTKEMGIAVTIATGVVGFMTESRSEVKHDLEAGITTITQGESGNSCTRSVTIENAYSTSANPEYVGANGDVFIGSSTNLIYGEAKEVGLCRSSADSPVTLRLQKMMTTGLTFGTEFVHSANHIQNVLLPKLYELRDSLLLTVDNMNTFVNNSEHTVYVTELTPDDPRYGTDNDDWDAWGDAAAIGPSSSGPSYRMVRGTAVSDDDMENDMVMFYNNSIKNWEMHLAENEKQKVDVYQYRDEFLKKNVSFDAGSTVTMTQTSEVTNSVYKDKTTMGLVRGSIAFGTKINWHGFETIISEEAGGGTHIATDSTTTESTTFSYTLQETGDDDALTVDVYDYGNGWGPIFRTRGGQTSAPYEGEVRTSYYHPGQEIIMEATMKIEDPKIYVSDHDKLYKWRMASNVPTGTAANYTLALTNESETGEDVYFMLLVPDESNPNGAKMSIDGLAITGDGRMVKVPAGETVLKALQLEQTNQSILQYDSIAVVLASQSQYDPTSTWEQIADTVYVSAEFIPSSSPVRMTLNKSVMNTNTADDLLITFDQFDRYYGNLKCFRIQSYAPGASDWVTLQEYVLDDDENEMKSGKLLLPDEASVEYAYNMHGMTDGLYRFRVIAVSSYGGREIIRSSEEISIVKDMVKPKPLGMPQPSNGILGIGDDISLTFSEEIVNGAITNDNNFTIDAVLNGAEVDHSTALALQGEARTASTEASISLAGKSFSTDMWLYMEGSGTILSHGNGSEKFALSLDADNHLVVSVGGEQYVSTDVMPMNSWCYLTVSFKAGEGEGILNASVSEAASTIRLFKDCQTVTYNGVGSLTIGENMTGAIHELTMWDVAHDNEQAQLQRQRTKSPATANLMGYWRMNEGEGRTITDYARNRHLIAAGDTWYINNENKAVALDGSAYLSVFAGDLAVDNEDNQTIEFWFKADKQADEAQLLDMDRVGLWMDSEGLLKLTSDEMTYDAGTKSLTDNEWHHIAMNILRSGSTSIYVDGQRTLSTASRNVALPNCGYLYMGAHRQTTLSDDGSHTVLVGHDRHLTGYVDELRIWNATLDASTLAANRKLRLTGTESGLVAYFPFETKTLDFGQIVTDTLSASIVNDGMTRFALYGNDKVTFTDEAPALKPKPVLTNVPFSFTASKEKIVINLEADPVIIEGCTINFKVRDVRDVHGNWCDPICWSAYVSRNSLVWDNDQLSIVQAAGDETTVSTTITNKGGAQQEWHLSGLPQWLKVSAEDGFIDPLAATELHFTVGTTCPIGKYAETIYLVNGDDIALPLALNVTVTGDVPDWSVDAGKYSSTMNLVGTLSINGVASNDPDDILAAFVDGECRGVAKPVYNKRYDEYFVMLDVACDETEKDKNVTFSIYDASTGIIWPVAQPSQEVLLSSGAVYGTFSAPVNLNALDLIQQTLSLGSGWSWTSFAVKPEDMRVASVMKDVETETLVVKSKVASSMFYEEGWSGSLTDFNNREMYKVLMASPRQLTVIGARPALSDKEISVEPGWNWIAFNETSIISVADAFAGITPEDGDLVKGKQGFAIYDGYEWEGSLQALTPGQGYMYLSKATGTRTFNYPATLTQISQGMQAIAQRSTSAFNPVSHNLFPGNMTVVARVTYDNEPMSDIEVGVFSGDECRTANYTDGQGIVFLTIPGNARENLSFVISYNGEMVQSPTTILYEEDGVIGNPGEPFVLAFGDGSVTAISGVGTANQQEYWYTIGGIRLTEKPTMPGVYYHVKPDATLHGEKVVIK